MSCSGSTQLGPYSPPHTLEPGGPAVLEDPDAWTVDEAFVRVNPTALVEDSVKTSIPRSNPDADRTTAPAQARWLVEVDVPTFGLTLTDIEMKVFVSKEDEQGQRTRVLALQDVESDLMVEVEFPVDAPPTGYASVGPWRAEW